VSDARNMGKRVAIYLEARRDFQQRRPILWSTLNRNQCLSDGTHVKQKMILWIIVRPHIAVGSYKS